MRARYPDAEGRVVRDGVALGYEVHGNPAATDRPTILLLPTWTIIHSRFWKMQVPYLVDPNTGTGMFESGDIIDYLRETYAA